MNMLPIKYNLPEIIFAEIFYFSESEKKEKTIKIKIKSFSYIQSKKHYIINYINEENKIKSISVEKIKNLKLLKLSTNIENKKLNNWLKELIKISYKEELHYVKKNSIPLNFNTNWVKGKKIVISGDICNKSDELLDRQEYLFPIIKKLEGDPKTAISGQTDVLITIGFCESNNKYIDAVKREIHIVDFEIFKQLYSREFKETLEVYPL